MNTIDSQLAREAKVMVALAFRNGPIEDIHAGKPCPTCRGKQGYSRLTDADIKLIMKNAVDHVYKLLWLWERRESRRSMKPRSNLRIPTPPHGTTLITNSSTKTGLHRQLSLNCHFTTTCRTTVSFLPRGKGISSCLHV